MNRLIGSPLLSKRPGQNQNDKGTNPDLLARRSPGEREDQMPIRTEKQKYCPGGSINSKEWKAIRAWIQGSAGDACELCKCRTAVALAMLPVSKIAYRDCFETNSSIMHRASSQSSRSAVIAMTVSFGKVVCTRPLIESLSLSSNILCHCELGNSRRCSSTRRWKTAVHCSAVSVPVRSYR